MDDRIQNPQELEFAIFCVESIAQRFGVKVERVYEALDEKSDFLYRYIVANYDVLHTQSKEYILDDLLTTMNEEAIINRFLHMPYF